ncbi:Na(+)/H(+) antiporter subunit C [Epidermidibacterium keratini]|uniref:Na(+)/H(+) antiporter subunit C n=1 Tax=Epidermidibacterium keratini TaxID=1891644 RepID=A0A7L4YND4_9ACTN|nr:Na(+)/H(+) antiporter subunit C [Epidermidibacterium keratini]QHC00801.1 Na(+)/H(+) antiporter subunit C [Epidermidibacterium keratini]
MTTYARWITVAEDSAPNITLIIVAAVLAASGTYLLLDRQLVRILLGVVLASNGVGLLFMVASGRAGGSPLVGERPPEEMSDPLPQAMVLTAIVIALATVSYVLALAYRQWQLTGRDDAPDDVEDAIIQRRAERDETSSTYDADTASTTEAEEDPDEVSDEDLVDVQPVSAEGVHRNDDAPGGKP